MYKLQFMISTIYHSLFESLAQELYIVNGKLYLDLFGCNSLVGSDGNHFVNVLDRASA